MKKKNWLPTTLKILLVEIVVLMALGAFVRAMNAGLSCPDWPLCFGKVIPDFHPGVWYEFIHRADAGLVAITYLAVFLVIMFSRKTASTGAVAKPTAVRWTAAAALITLLMLISAGAMTVLKQVAWLAVTTHLMLATTFLCLVLRILLITGTSVKPAATPAPQVLKWATGFIAFGVYVQIMLGGVVASTYAGSVCVDWPLCNGQWVPTWSGAIGHQIIHRFVAYALAIATLILAGALQALRERAWVTPQLLRMSRWALGLVFVQVALGAANLLFYIPPWITVPHQSVALILLATDLRLFQIAYRLAGAAVTAPSTSGAFARA